jgi:3-phenylpropionate/trans-cinnamate dioxygenase ferredoxin reductase component
MTAAAAIQGIRELDRSGSIGLIGSEPHPPYNRPPLSKKLWKGKPLESIWRANNKGAATLHLGRTARLLDPELRQITDDQGTVYTYGKLLLATGATPHRLPFGGETITYFRTLDDYHRLRAQTEHGERFAVIGGGFIGSEVAAALALNGKQVVMVLPDEAIGSRVFPADLAGFLNDFYRNKGVEVMTGASAVDCETRGNKTVLTVRDVKTAAEREVMVDGVVAGIGVLPNVELAQAAGLEVENGIRVDATLRTSHSDIYAAGDVASVYNSTLNQWLRVEHEDNANSMGAYAGKAMANGGFSGLTMAGRTASYDHLPFFYSDLFELGYEAIGEVDSRLETIADWKDPFREGVVYYMRHGRVRGVLLWNVWEQVEAARRLIGQGGPFNAENLKGRVPV